jgi:hypothetical protein
MGNFQKFFLGLKGDFQKIIYEKCPKFFLIFMQNERYTKNLYIWGYMDGKTIGMSNSIVDLIEG